MDNKAVDLLPCTLVRRYFCDRLTFTVDGINVGVDVQQDGIFLHILIELKDE